MGLFLVTLQEMFNRRMNQARERATNQLIASAAVVGFVCGLILGWLV